MKRPVTIRRTAHCAVALKIDGEYSRPGFESLLIKFEDAVAEVSDDGAGSALSFKRWTHEDERKRARIENVAAR